MEFPKRAAIFNLISNRFWSSFSSIYKSWESTATSKISNFIDFPIYISLCFNSAIVSSEEPNFTAKEEKSDMPLNYSNSVSKHS